MRRVLIGILLTACVVIFYFTLSTARDVFSSDLSAPPSVHASENEYRLVLISQELDSPFWTELEKGALAAAEKYGVSLEAWGTFGLNEVDFVHNFEIAIASKVDGIIVQGLDTEDFKKLTKTRAAGNGIPVITVGSDVPVSESIRRTYVGSNHYEAGQLLAKQLIADMGTTGKVILMVGNQNEFFQEERLSGILDTIRDFSEIESEIIVAGNTNEKVAEVTNSVLNRDPGTKAFISVTSNSATVVTREIGKRYKKEDFYIYAFDESPDTLKLLRNGSIDALIQQSPERMGELSVELMVRWLQGKDLPLNFEGYFTDIKVLKAEDLP